MSHAFNTCSQSHNEWSAEFGGFYDIQSLLSSAIATTPREKQADYSVQLDEFSNTFWNYIAHILRTKHQGDYYRWNKYAWISWKGYLSGDLQINCILTVWMVSLYPCLLRLSIQWITWCSSYMYNVAILWLSSITGGQVFPL